MIDGLAGFYTLFKSRKVGFGHLAVAFQAKQRGYINVDTFTDELFDSGNAFFSARDFNKKVGSIYPLPKFPGLFNRAVCVVGQVRRYLQAYIAVASVRFIKDGPE